MASLGSLMAVNEILAIMAVARASFEEQAKTLFEVEERRVQVNSMAHVLPSHQLPALDDSRWSGRQWT